MAGWIDYLRRRKDLRRLRALILSDFVAPTQAHTDLLRVKIVDSDELFKKHAEFGCDSRVYMVEHKRAWISVIAEDPVTGQIVFGTTFFLFQSGDPLTFWKQVPGSDTFQQIPLSKMEWYRGGKVVSVGYTLCSHSPAANVIETESIRKINEHFRKTISDYVSIFKKTVIRTAELFEAEILIEPHGYYPIPMAFTFFPSVNVQGYSQGLTGRTRNESMITEHICRRAYKIPLRKEVNGLLSLSSVFFGRLGSANISERRSRQDEKQAVPT